MVFSSNNEVYISFSYILLPGGNYFPTETPNSRTIRLLYFFSFPLLIRRKQKTLNLNNMKHIRKEQNLKETCPSPDSIKEDRRCLWYCNVKKTPPKPKKHSHTCKIIICFKNRENQNNKLRKTKNLATISWYILFLHIQAEAKIRSC